MPFCVVSIENEARKAPIQHEYKPPKKSKPNAKINVPETHDIKQDLENLIKPSKIWERIHAWINSPTQLFGKRKPYYFKWNLS